LSVPLIRSPHAFVLVSILVKLDAKTIFKVIFPVSYISRSHHPFLSLDTSIFLSLLFL
jgi:hypothetical protein